MPTLLLVHPRIGYRFVMVSKSAIIGIREATAWRIIFGSTGSFGIGCLAIFITFPSLPAAPNSSY